MEGVDIAFEYNNDFIDTRVRGYTIVPFRNTAVQASVSDSGGRYFDDHA